MLQNKDMHKIAKLNIKLLSLSALVLLQTACGGGDGNSEAAAIGIEDVSIAYIKRPTPRDDNGVLITDDMREPTAFTEGGDLYLQARASTAATTINVTRGITNGLGDVKNVSVSYDGTKLIFSLRLEDLTNGANTPKWNLYEYDILSGSLSTPISVGIQEEGDDIAPQYLPDGRIIFSSTRQTVSKGIRTNEGRGTFTATDEDRRNHAFLLHVLNADGTIKQVSFNESHDLDPIVLKESGRVLFSRWNNMGGRDDVSLYSMAPDGTDVQLYYGAHSHQSGTNLNADVHFSKPRQMADGRVLSIYRPFVTNFGGGDVVFINGNDFADKTQPIWSQQGFISGTAETVFKQNVVNGVGLPLKGRYNAIFPMLDGSNRYLMSWSQCQILSVPLDPASIIIPCTLATAAQLSDVNLTEAPPSYGIFLVDADSNTQVPLIKPELDTVYSEIVMAYATNVPPVIFDRVAGVSADIDSNFAAEGVGVLHIRSVYDFDNGFSAYGATLPTADDNSVPITIDTPAEMANPINTIADERPARFVRITKSVSQPDRDVKRIDNTAFGRSTQQGMREIVGYAPVEPDGSIKIKVPADVPLTISVLDKDGRRISNRHQSWFQVKAGATLECVGCHAHNTNDQANNKPHGRPNYESTFNPGSTTSGIGFPNSLISMWAQMGETMAETRARQSCLPSNPTPCADLKPSTDLAYVDVWTDDVASNRSADASFTIDYTDVQVSPFDASASTTTDACVKTGKGIYDDTITSFSYCRIVINYQTHIQPIWEKARGVADADTCTGCHTTNGGTQVAPGQLELTSTASSDEPDHIVSYRELLFNDNQQEFNGNLVDVSVDTGTFVLDGNGDPVLDINGDPIPIFAPVTVSASMSTAGARASYFMEKITNTELNAGRTLSGTTDHSSMLTDSELKLISEWLDIGAQYFNNPFDSAVPTN